QPHALAGRGAGLPAFRGAADRAAQPENPRVPRQCRRQAAHRRDRGHHEAARQVAELFGRPRDGDAAPRLPAAQSHRETARLARPPRHPRRARPILNFLGVKPVMVSKPRSATSPLRVLVPAGALAFYGVIQFLGSNAPGAEPGLVISLSILPVLLATVIAAVFHAEEIAHETGEPYGTLVLTIAVTIIEVALIMSITLSGKGDPALARDTVFSVIMIVCNGIVGLCRLAGGLQYLE